VGVLRAILEEAKRIESDVISWRRDFHMHPELGYQERRTSEIVARNLEAWGYAVIRGVAETGVVGVLAGGSGGRVVALRADMDALPVDEENEVPYRSRIKGVMHACGHDAHTAMLLGAARILSKLRDRLPGTVKLIFQPAEEGGNGAERMIREGVLDDPKVDAIFGLHVWSQLPSGTVGLREGPVLAATGEIRVTVRGRGGHGAYPHLSVDPIVAASSVVLNLQSVVSRNLDPTQPGVVSICYFHSGTAFNVIPDVAELRGTYRALTYEVRDLIKKRVSEVVEKTCAAYGAECTCELVDSTPPTVNDPEAVRLARSVAAEVVGGDKVVDMKPSMGGEDFAFYLERVPGAFVALGSGNPEKGTDKPHHSPRFDVDEDVLYLGSALYAALAYAFLEKGLKEAHSA